MSSEILDRITTLEREVTALKQAIGGSGRVKDWRRTVGMFEGDPLMEEIDKLTLQVREEDRRKARQRNRRRKSSKS
jgi:hypothetical protein